MIDWGNFVRLDSDASLDPGEEFESSEARRALPIRIAVLYGGSNAGDVPAEAIPHHGPPFSVRLTLPPMAALVLQPGGKR